MLAGASVENVSPHNERLPRRERLHRQADFLRLRRHGKRKGGKYLVMRYEHGESFPAMGIAVGRVVGGAVVRAAVRRRIRESYRKNRFALKPARMLFIARPQSAQASVLQIGEEMKVLWRRADLWKQIECNG